jgi:Cu/Ag efflux protein CusF
MKRALSTLFATLFLTVPAWAEMGHSSHGSAMDHGAMAGMSNTPSKGVVKKVNKAQGKLTISHGPLENLGMPAMTMIFRVQDDAMLDRVKPGDNIRFLADKVNGRLTVTRIETTQ